LAGGDDAFWPAFAAGRAGLWALYSTMMMGLEIPDGRMRHLEVGGYKSK
jgi:hypothetical protein